jgi:hypothetical protein
MGERPQSIFCKEFMSDMVGWAAFEHLPAINYRLAVFRPWKHGICQSRRRGADGSLVGRETRVRICGRRRTL